MAVIEWLDTLKKSGGNGRMHCDVRITNYKKAGRDLVFIKFANRLDEKISHTQYISLGIAASDCRLYFKEDILKTDRKISHCGKTNTNTGTVFFGAKTDLTEPWIGEYKLLYDAKEELYYIQKGEQ